MSATAPTESSPGDLSGGSPRPSARALKARDLVSNLIEALAHQSEFPAQRNRLRPHRLRLGDLFAGGGDLLTGSGDLFAGGADLFGDQTRQVADRMW